MVQTSMPRPRSEQVYAALEVLRAARLNRSQRSVLAAILARYSTGGREAAKKMTPEQLRERGRKGGLAKAAKARQRESSL